MKSKKANSEKPEGLEAEVSKIPGIIEPETINIPDELPVLGLKDVVVFPQMVTALGISTEKELKLLDNVLASNRFVALVAQKSQEKEKVDPSEETWRPDHCTGPIDLYRTGLPGHFPCRKRFFSARKRGRQGRGTRYECRCHQPAEAGETGKNC